MRVGDAAEITRCFSRADAAELAVLSGLDPETVTAVPEPLIAALFSHLLGAELPGFGTNYLKQEMEFLTAAGFGEALTARVMVTRLRPDKELVDLETTCRRANGELICTGCALVLVRDRVETT
jgi:3-hydroxybutyryl-CoA dehydratase